MSDYQRLLRLDALLAEHGWLWQPQPYKEARPAWCDRLPGLCDELLALSDDQLERLTEHPAELNRLLAAYLPALAEFPRLTALAPLEPVSLKAIGSRFAAGIPGRKWQQITRFSRAVGAVRQPVLEWCGGKGHLGRLMAQQWQQPVTTLEWDEGLCESGETMAQRVGVAQRFYRADALTADSTSVLQGHHALALHACGELHRTLVKSAVAQQLPALDIAPCCYHLHGEEEYRPLNDALQLQLSRDDRRLAVTETVTAVGREVRQRDREMAWKLGFGLLRRDVTGDASYHPLKPIDKRWLRFDFAGFCRTLAEREGIALGEISNWRHYEQAGWQRQGETMRLSLVRHAFRRALELWLVLDLVCYLEGSGYRVRYGSFCEPALTPRNILISARRQG
ncbi:MAG: methyltransferase [Pseudomonadota bacterium]